MIAKFMDWLTLRDFNAELENARIGVIRRYARRNVMFQNGSLLDSAALEKLRFKGDKAAQDIFAGFETFVNAGSKVFNGPDQQKNV